MYDDIDVMNYTSMPQLNSVFSLGAPYSMPMPMMGFGYNNPQAYYDNMKDYQRFTINYNVDQQNMNRNADLRINATMEGVKGAATALKDKILKNEQDQIPEAYDKYIKAVAEAYGNGDTTPQEIQARAKSLYTQLNGGVTLTQDLREHGHGSFTQGLLNALTFGTYFRSSAEDNVAYTTNSPVGTKDKVAQHTGRLVGAATLGTAVGATCKLLGKTATKNAGNLSKLAKLGSKAGIIGLGVAAGAALLSFIRGK